MSGLAWNERIVSLGELRPFERNPRKISPAAIERLKNAIGRVGYHQRILATEDLRVIGGHQRIRVLKELGFDAIAVLVPSQPLSDEEFRRLVIEDNLLFGEFDREILAADYDKEELLSWGMPQLELNFGDEDENHDGEIPETEESEPVTQLGDIWQLGDHRIMCGDSTSAAAMTALMDGSLATIVHADPPYGMGKESAGVVNDNIYAAQLVDFQCQWFAAAFPHLTKNASGYIWGNAEELWRLWYSDAWADVGTRRTLRNEIVWDKKTIAGMKSPELTHYPTATERCLFFQMGDVIFQAVNQTKDEYWSGWDEVRLYLTNAKQSAQLRAKDINKITETQMAGHWFNTSQFSPIDRDNYEKLRAAHPNAFTLEWAELSKMIEKAKAIFEGTVKHEFMTGRPFFDNAHDIMHDVWEFPRVVGEERHGHATPKPVAMMERVIKSSSRFGDIVLEPFAGTGSTLIAAERAGRKCNAMELQPKYCDVVVKRWERFTGKKAVNLTTGDHFPDLTKKVAA